MKKKQLFLLGSGRSGTTLIQRILNTLPETMVWGEHSGSLSKLASFYFYLKEDSSLQEFCYDQAAPEGTKDLLNYYKNPDIWQAWVNWFKPGELDSHFRELLESMFCPEHLGTIKVWGFKEIRYKESDRVIEFLLTIYPEAQFLIVARDGLNTITSQLLTFHQGTTKYKTLKRLIQLPKIARIAKIWQIQNNYYFKLSTSLPDNFNLVHFEEVKDKVELLDPILEKVGLKITSTQHEVVSLKNGRGSNLPSAKIEQRWHELGFIVACIVEVIVGATCQNIGYKRPNSLKIPTYLSALLK